MSLFHPARLLVLGIFNQKLNLIVIDFEIFHPAHSFSILYVCLLIVDSCQPAHLFHPAGLSERLKQMF